MVGTRRRPRRRAVLPRPQLGSALARNEGVPNHHFRQHELGLLESLVRYLR